MRTWYWLLAALAPRPAGYIAVCAAMGLVCSALIERPACAQEAGTRPAFRLESSLLDEESDKLCPHEGSIRGLFNRVFGYEVIDPEAGPSFAIDIAYNDKRKVFEVVGHVLRDDGYVLGTELDISEGANADACFQTVYGMVIALQSAQRELKDPLTAPRKAAAESSSEAFRGFVLRDQVRAMLQRPAQPAPAAPAAPPPPAVASTQEKVPEGFMLHGGVIASIALLPTPSVGGVVGMSYRKGEWSGGVEVRLERGMVPAYLRNILVDALYAGAALTVPFVHQGAFSAGFVTEAGGYSCSMDQSLSISGRFFMIAIGLRTNLDLRVSEHFLVRGFVQASALPVSPYLDITDQRAWSSGPGFGSVGLTIVALP